MNKAEITNEVPHRKRWGIKRNCAEANLSSRGASACAARALKSYGAVHLTIHPCSPAEPGFPQGSNKLQGILAKANKGVENE